MHIFCGMQLNFQMSFQILPCFWTVPFVWYAGTNLKPGQYSILYFSFQNFSCVDSGLFHHEMLSVLLKGLSADFKNPFYQLLLSVINYTHSTNDYRWGIPTICHLVSFKQKQCVSTSPFGQGKRSVSVCLNGKNDRQGSDPGSLKHLLSLAFLGSFLKICPNCHFWVVACSSIFNEMYITGEDKLWAAGQIWPTIWFYK